MKAWAVDNVADDPTIFIQRASGAPFEEQTPDSAIWRTRNELIGSAVTHRMARHTYPRAGASDTIIVTAGDGRSGVQFRIPITVVRFAPDFRQIGQEIKTK